MKGNGISALENKTSAAKRDDSDRQAKPTGGRFRNLSMMWRWLLVVAVALTIALAVNQMLNLKFFVNVVIIDHRYYYLTLGLLIPFVYIIFPARRGTATTFVPWYDVVLAALMFFCMLFFAWVAEQAEAEAWEFSRPDYVVPICFLVWALVLEAVRRSAGHALFFVILIASLYPLVANDMPAPFKGMSLPAVDVASYHVISAESLLGIPLRTVANIVLGFIVFGSALQYSGCGKFFMDVAFSLMGHVRGGPAKVSIFASGLLGSLSGSVTTNVLTTGTLTIPAMKRTGFSPRYAGGVETAASTGAVLTPPIMGAVAFVMAAVLNVPYAQVIVAASIPSLLYYFGLFVSIDAYASRYGLKGMNRNELPGFWRSMKDGWQYIFVFVFLIYMLLVEQQERIGPYYATLILIAINQALPHTRWRWSQFFRFAEATARLLAELAATLAAIGLVVGAFTMTGMAATFTNDLVLLAGGNPFVLLFAGAATCFVLGLGMPVTAAYIFLAVVLAPGVISMGFDPVAVHLFLLYWGMLSFITPPVAIGAFAAAAVAEADIMGTAFEAMRLGTILYFIPFFFVFNPALILHGDLPDILMVTGTAFVGVFLISAALQGYLIGVGSLVGSWKALVGRVFVALGGFLFAMPGGKIGHSNNQFAVMAAVVSGLGVMIAFRKKHAFPAREASGD